MSTDIQTNMIVILHKQGVNIELIFRCILPVLFFDPPVKRVQHEVKTEFKSYTHL